MQNLLYPVALKPVEVLTGIFVAVNTTFTAQADFVIEKKMWYSYFTYDFILKMNSYDFNKIKEIEYKVQLNKSDSLSDKAVLLSDKFSSSCIRLISILTRFNNPVELSSEVMFDIPELPKIVVEVTKSINACKFVKRVRGSEMSVIKFGKSNITIKGGQEDFSDVKTSDIVTLMLEVNAIAKFFNLEMVNIDKLSQLFEEPENFMDVELFQIENGNMELHYGPGYNKDEIKFFSLFQPCYDISGDLKVCSTFEITRKQLIDEVKNPDGEKLINKAVNILDYAIIDDVFTDPTLGKVNKSITYSGMKGINDPIDQEAPELSYEQTKKPLLKKGTKRGKKPNRILDEVNEDN